MTVCILPIFPDNLNAVKNCLHIFVRTFISPFSWVCLGMEFVEHMTILKLLNCSFFFGVYSHQQCTFFLFPTHVPSNDSSVTVATLVWSGASLLWWLMCLLSIYISSSKKCLNYLKNYFSFSHVSFYMHVHVAMEPRKEHRVPWSWSYRQYWAARCGHWELLEKNPSTGNAEPSLQFNSFFICAFEVVSHTVQAGLKFFIFLDSSH